MERILYIKASPREGRSHSVAVADAFIEAWREAHPGGEVVVKNLFTEDLPSFDGQCLQAKYNIMHGREHTAEEAQSWKAVEELITEFKSFDRVVFAVPMWNFSLPYRLKQYFDLIIQPGYTVGMNENGYFGMVENTKVLAVYASGGEYQMGNPVETFDFQSTYLKMILGFIGITDVTEIGSRGTLSETRDANKQVALAQARELAKTF